MKKLLVPLVFIVAMAFGPGVWAQVQPVKFDFQAVTVAQVINLVYNRAFTHPFVIDPAVLNDQRVVSFRFDSGKGDLRQFWTGFLASLGIVVETRSGVDFVSLRKPEQSQSTVQELFVYRPRFRPLSYLVDVLGGLFKMGAFSVQRGVSTQPGEPSPSNPPPVSAASSIQADADTLVFQGSPQDVARLRVLLRQIDVHPGEVMISAVVYEVSAGKSDGSAFSLALNLLGGKLGLSLGGAPALSNAVTFKNASIDVALSILARDSRFKALSTPRLRVRSGAQARLMVGQDVPTVGAVSYPQGGVPVQSIEYRSSGVILALMPTAYESSVDVVIDQQISDFAKTETGVSSSPTLTKRALSTTVTLGNDEFVVLGGLMSHKAVEGTSGLSFLPRLLRDSTSSSAQTEVLLLLQVSRVSAE
jgi:type II secretory pathway component GspD/PulD (secretin)